MFSREVEEGEQRVAILDQALHRTFVFDEVFLDEDVDRGFSFGPVWGQIDVPQVVLQ